MPLARAVGMRAVADQQEFFVLIAVCVGALKRVAATAAELSLTAKNAKVIAYRAGTRAVGFKPLTDFIDEMARDTARLVAVITSTSLGIARRAVDERRLVEASERLDRARRAITSEQPRIDEVRGELGTDIAGIRHDIERGSLHLLELLDEINHHMRAASVIATRARIEATQAADYQGSLQLVADTVERSAATIRDIISTCQQRLRAAA